MPRQTGRSRGDRRRGGGEPEVTGRTATVWEQEQLHDDPTVLLGPATPEDPDDVDLDAPTRRQKPVADGPTVELPPSPVPASDVAPGREGFAGFDEVLPSVLAEAEAARSIHAESTQSLISGVTRTLPAPSGIPARDPEQTVPGSTPDGPTRQLRVAGYLGPEAATVRTPISSPPRASSVPAVARPSARGAVLTTETKSGLAGLVVGLVGLALAILAVALYRAM